MIPCHKRYADTTAEMLTSYDDKGNTIHVLPGDAQMRIQIQPAELCHPTIGRFHRSPHTLDSFLRNVTRIKMGITTLQHAALRRVGMLYHMFIFFGSYPAGVRLKSDQGRITSKSNPSTNTPA